MRFLAIFLVTILVSVSAAWAQMVSSGSISGTLDGESMTWDTLEIPGEASTTNYSEWSPGNVSVTVQGHVGGKFGIEKSLSITFTLLNNGSANDAELLYIPTNSLSDYYEGKGGAVTLSLDPVAKDGDQLLLSGSVKGTLVRTKRDGLKFDVDEGDTIVVEANFESRAKREE